MFSDGTVTDGVQRIALVTPGSSAPPLMPTVGDQTTGLQYPGAQPATGPAAALAQPSAGAPLQLLAPAQPVAAVPLQPPAPMPLQPPAPVPLPAAGAAAAPHPKQQSDVLSGKMDALELFNLNLFNVGLATGMQIPETWPTTWAMIEALGILPDHLVKAIRARSGPKHRGSSSFMRPTAIQTLALPLALTPLSGVTYANLVAQSPSGTGKTAAFSLALLARLDPTLPTTQAIVICCSRELARQVFSEIELFALEDMRIKVRLFIPHAKDEPSAFQVAVGTPGKLHGAMRKRHIKPDGVRVLVVDEADTLIRTPHSARDGAVNDVRQILPKIPKTAQRLLFSATFEQDVEALCDEVAPKANTIKLEGFSSLKYINQVIVRCKAQEEKCAGIAKIFDSFAFGAAFVFANTRTGTAELAKELRKRNYKVAGLMGAAHSADFAERKRIAEARDLAMQQFRSSQIQALIATNVLARGIDELRTRLVINYELPTSRTAGPAFDRPTYIHRIGRCGRFGTIGWAVTFVTPSDEPVLNGLLKDPASDGIRVCTDIDEFIGLLPKQDDHTDSD